MTVLAPIAACAAIATKDSARLAVGGVADRPVLREFADASDDALAAFAEELAARDDLHATAEFRRNLVRRFGRITIDEARKCRA